MRRPRWRIGPRSWEAEFPLLSDHDRKISALYGVLAPSGYANRATFVIDMEGKVAFIEEGNSAIDVTSADTACSRLAHKKQELRRPQLL